MTRGLGIHQSCPSVARHCSPVWQPAIPQDTQDTHGGVGDQQALLAHSFRPAGRTHRNHDQGLRFENFRGSCPNFVWHRAYVGQELNPQDAHGGVGDQQALVASHGFSPARRALVQDDLAPPGGWGTGGNLGGIGGLPLQASACWLLDVRARLQPARHHIVH